jgi:hypothetical protein
VFRAFVLFVHFGLGGAPRSLLLVCRAPALLQLILLLRMLHPRLLSPRPTLLTLFLRSLAVLVLLEQAG